MYLLASHVKVLAGYPPIFFIRTQCVRIDTLSSENLVLKFGIPQGSHLWPILFTLFMSPLYDVVRFNIDFHAYADDTQLYKIVTKNEI